MKDYDVDRFLENVKDHTMKIFRDDGVDRHISFTNNGSSVYQFDLITWHGHLTITGDFGTFVFRRVEDMFTFFRRRIEDVERNPEKKIHINPGYWSQKLLAAPITHNGNGFEEYSEDRFRKVIREWFDSYYEDETPERRAEIWEQVETEVFYEAEFEAVAYRNAMNFRYDGKEPFQDFWDANTREYSFHFIWCLYAIVWGINKYDEVKEAPNE